jgi:hypothetical protein
VEIDFKIYILSSQTMEYTVFSHLHERVQKAKEPISSLS